jgi:hypothetical protein
MRYFMSAVRIGIAVAIINGAGRTAAVYWTYYQFQDAAQQLAILGYQSSTEVLKSNAYIKAAELLVPISEDQIVVTRDGAKTFIQAAYVHPVEYFPNQLYPLKLSFSVEGRNLSTSVQVQ